MPESEFNPYASDSWNDSTDFSGGDYSLYATQAADALNAWNDPTDFSGGNHDGATDTSSGGFTQMAKDWWKEIKELKGGTQSIIASGVFAGIKGLFSKDYKSRELDILQQNQDTKARQQQNAMTSTAESYDKTKYQIPGVFKPTGLIRNRMEN